MNNLKKYSLDMVVTALERDHNNTVKATFKCDMGYIVLYSDAKGFGMIIIQENRTRKVAPEMVANVMEANELFAEHVMELLRDQEAQAPGRVDEEFACPNPDCRESRMSQLEWTDDDSVQCNTCGRPYTIQWS